MSTTTTKKSNGRQSITTKEQAVAAFRAEKITLDEYTEIIESLKGSSGDKRTIKRNSKGGLFVRDTDVKAYSERTGKDYVAAINLPWPAAVALFGPDSTLLPEVRQFVKQELAD